MDVHSKRQKRNPIGTLLLQLVIWTVRTVAADNTGIRVHWVLHFWQENVTEEMFWDNLETIFTQDARDYLAEKDWNSLSVMGDEDWTVVTLLVILSVDEDGWTDKSMGLEFEWTEDKWLLTSVSIRG